MRRCSWLTSGDVHAWQRDTFNIWLCASTVCFVSVRPVSADVVLCTATCGSPRDALPACSKQSLGFPTFPEPPPPFFNFRSWFPQAEVGRSSCVFTSKLHSWSPLPQVGRWVSPGPHKPQTETSCFKFIKKMEGEKEERLEAWYSNLKVIIMITVWGTFYFTFKKGILH